MSNKCIYACTHLSSNQVTTLAANIRPASVGNGVKAKPPWEERLIAYFVTPLTSQGSNAKGFRGNRPASVNHVTKGRGRQAGRQLTISSTVCCLQWLPKSNSYFHYLISQRVCLDVWHTLADETAKISAAVAKIFTRNLAGVESPR